MHASSSKLFFTLLQYNIYTITYKHLHTEYKIYIIIYGCIDVSTQRFRRSYLKKIKISPYGRDKSVLKPHEN